MWKRILIATDGTAAAQIAAEQAIALAVLTQAQFCSSSNSQGMELSQRHTALVYI